MEARFFWVLYLKRNELWDFPDWLLGTSTILSLKSAQCALPLVQLLFSAWSNCLTGLCWFLFCWVPLRLLLLSGALPVNSSHLGFPEHPVSSSQLGDPTGHSLGSPPGASAWGLSWGSRAGQPWDSHPVFHVSRGTLPFVASCPESWELLFHWSYLVCVFRFWFFSPCSGRTGR